MTDDLDLRGIHRRHEPDPGFVAALGDRIEAIVAAAPAVSPDEPIALTLEPEDSPHAPSGDRRRWIAAGLGLVAASVAAFAVVASRDQVAQDEVTAFPVGSPANDSTTVSEPTTTLALADLEDGRQFRVGNVIVTIQCTAIKSTPDSASRDLVLGGVVTDNPDASATLDGVSVAMGDLLALIIREDQDGSRRVTLYDNTQWFGGATISSCGELVESVPTWVDGGFFEVEFPGGYEILPGGGST